MTAGRSSIEIEREREREGGKVSERVWEMDDGWNFGDTHRERLGSVVRDGAQERGDARIPSRGTVVRL